MAMDIQIIFDNSTAAMALENTMAYNGSMIGAHDVP
jgi:hypothetical protein